MQDSPAAIKYYTNCGFQTLARMKGLKSKPKCNSGTSSRQCLGLISRIMATFISLLVINSY